MGGGPAGLALAHYAQREGRPFGLFERSQALGGHCRTLEHAGHRYDTGAHRFHDRDPEITADVRALLGEALVPVRAPSEILHRGRRIQFPPRPWDWLKAAGFRGAIASLAEIARGRLRPREEHSFEDRVVNQYGRTLGGPLLLDYSRKLWGLPGSELAPDVATRRLSGLSFVALARELLFRRRRSEHLDGDFLYPRSGYGAISDELARSLPAGAVHRGRAVAALVLDGDRVAAIRLEDGAEFEVRGRLVSTLPLTVLVRLLAPALAEPVREAARALRFRSVRLVFLRLSQPTVTTCATIYLPDPAGVVSRLAEPRNRSAALAPPGETALVAEVPCWPGDAVAKLDEASLARIVVDELVGVGLIRAEWVIDWRHHLLESAYPVYALGYRERLATIDAGLAGFTNLDRLGRGGRFWYSHLHDQMRLAKDYLTSLSTGAAGSG